MFLTNRVGKAWESPSERYLCSWGIGGVGAPSSGPGSGSASAGGGGAPGVGGPGPGGPGGMGGPGSSGPSSAAAAAAAAGEAAAAAAAAASAAAAAAADSGAGGNVGAMGGFGGGSSVGGFAGMGNPTGSGPGTGSGAPSGNTGVAPGASSGTSAFGQDGELSVSDLAQMDALAQLNNPQNQTEAQQALGLLAAQQMDNAVLSPVIEMLSPLSPSLVSLITGQDTGLDSTSSIVNALTGEVDSTTDAIGQVLGLDAQNALDAHMASRMAANDAVMSKTLMP